MKLKQNKLLIKAPVNRNPLVVLALKRKAGSHNKTEKALRRKDRVNLTQGCRSYVEKSVLNRTERTKYSPLP